MAGSSPVPCVSGGPQPRTLTRTFTSSFPAATDRSERSRVRSAALKDRRRGSQRAGQGGEAGGGRSYKDASTRTVSAGAVDLVYRELGPKASVPVIFLVQPLAVVVVGASRIYLGAHWMIGVLGGMPWGNIGRRRRSGLSVVARNRWGEHDRRRE